MVTRKRHAFTIVELLVVIAIITMLMAILVPAVNRARATAQRTNCLNNMVQVAKGLAAYTTSHRSQAFPGRVSDMHLPDPKTPGQTLPVVVTDPTPLGRPMPGITWAMRILSQLDRQDLADELSKPAGPPAPPISSIFTVPRDDTENMARLYLPVLVCPSDAPASKAAPYLSYVVNSGVLDVFGPDRRRVDLIANGIFHDLRPAIPGRRDRKNPSLQLQVRTSDIRDGASNTLLLAENVDAGFWTSLHEFDIGFLWAATDRALGINIETGSRLDDDYDTNAQIFARPSSRHTGGVNVVFAGGNGQFLSEQIEYRVYVQLMTTNSQKAWADPITKTVMPIQFRELISNADYGAG